MIQSKRITEGALLTAVYIVLLLLTVFVPFFILIGICLLLVPFIMYASKYGWKSSIIMFIGALIISLLIATIVSLPITLLVGIGGIVIGTAIYQGVKAYETWARGALGFILGFLLVLALIYFVLDVN